MNPGKRMIVMKVCEVITLRIRAMSSAGVVGGKTTIYQFSLFNANLSAYPSGAPSKTMKRITNADAIRGSLVKLIPQANRNIPTTSKTTNIRR